MYILDFEVLESTEYYSFLDFAFQVCDIFYLVEREDIALANYKQGLMKDNKIKELLSCLKPSLINAKFQNEWPFTKLGNGGKAKVYYFEANDKTKEILKEFSSSISDWMYPNLLEDFGMLKGYNMWYSSCVHENMFTVITTDSSEIENISELNGKRCRVVEHDIDKRDLVVNVYNLT